jgi:hypothetical protein
MECMRRSWPIFRLMLAAALIASEHGSVHAFDRSGARILELQQDLRTVRPRTLREPRAAAYDLRNL